MRNLVKLSVLLGIAALFMLFVAGSAGAFEIEPEIEPGGEGEAAAEPEAAAPAEAGPEGTAVRIDFEIAGHVAKKGHYSVQTVGGAEIASWYALDGWEDSGWLSNIDVGNRTVWVQVLYYPGPDTVPTHMLILNHVPGDEYGWVANGEAHALEVAWPETELVCWVTDGEERTAYFSRSFYGIVHRTMVKDGKHDIYKPDSLFDQPGDGWKLWDYKQKGACAGANATAANYNDYLGADSPYWHLAGGK